MAKPKLLKDGPLLSALREWMQLRGVRRKVLAKAWGVQPSAVSKRLNGRVALEGAELLDLLERLGLDPEEFCRGLRAGFHAELFLARIAKEDKEQVKNLVRHHLRRPPARAYSPDELRDMAGGLEALRFRDRDAARNRALEILRSPDLDPDVAGEAWGVLGVLHRYEGKISCAAYCYGQALRIGGSERLRARTWQRLAMLLLFNVGDSDLALRATRWARAVYQECGDTVGVGKTLVDEGVIFVNTGEYRRAAVGYKKALRLLDGESSVSLFGALQGIAVAHVFLGDVRQARKYLDQALRVDCGQMSPKIHASILWLRGEISLALDQLAEAAKHFLRVRTYFLDLEMVWELTLVSLRLAKVYALQRKDRQQHQLFKEMSYRLADINRANRVLGAAFGKFLAEDTRGQVSAEILEEIYRRMREGAQAAPPLLPIRITDAIRD